MKRADARSAPQLIPTRAANWSMSISSAMTVPLGAVAPELPSMVSSSATPPPDLQRQKSRGMEAPSQVPTYAEAYIRYPLSSIAETGSVAAGGR
jgi:hypothetical protein